MEGVTSQCQTSHFKVTIHQLFQSKAQSTSQRYLKEIGKFICWCKLVKVQLQIAPPVPFSVALVQSVQSV